ncbi:RimK/LysX family protein [Photobacterium minamisatsumaniensis]|uniref:putative ATP-dependent zinc protease n=1 Tax=Photobacterium minamisatsumaniensis TaxID=2910233 RepID=UPI003D0AED7A
MKKIAPLFMFLLLSGCAQQTSEVTDTIPEKEIGGTTDPITPPVVIEPEVPVTPDKTPEIIPEPKPEIKPVEPIKPVVTKTDDGKLILGSEEWIWLSPANQYVRARVDSGKKISTIGVSQIQAFERDGRDWVKFNAGGDAIELPVERWLRNKTNDTRQAVVKLRAKLGELNELTEFSLTVGKGIILGGNFIKDVAVVDGQRKYVQPKAPK